MRNRLIRLGSPQLVILAAGILQVVLLTYSVEQRLWDDVFARAYALPGMEERWGFRFGTFRAGGYEHSGIVSIAPDGRLARLGVRQHDLPGEFSRHPPPPSVVLYRALLASERGEATILRVANMDDYAATWNPVVREIHLPPGR